MSNETRPVTGGTSGGLMRSLALCCCEVGKFSVRLMRDPGGVVSKLLSTPEVQACILLVGGYYITDSMQRRRCNRTSVGASSKHDCVEDVDDTDASVSSNVRRLNVSMNDNSI